jgi:hypothetical protein
VTRPAWARARVPRTRVPRTRVPRTRVPRTRVPRTRITRAALTVARIARSAGRRGPTPKPRRLHAWSPRALGRTIATSGCPRRPGIARPPVRPGGVAVCVCRRVAARRRTGRSLRRQRSPPVGAERILARAPPRTGPIPRSPHHALRPRRLRPVRPVCARRHPPSVRQPVLMPRHRSAVRRTPVRRPRGHRAAVARRTSRAIAVGPATWRRREATRRRRAQPRPAWLVLAWLVLAWLVLAWLVLAWLVLAWLGRHLSGAPQQLAVLVFVGIVRPVRARAVIGAVGAAIVQASSPGQAIGIAAGAGIATFHQVPPGRWCPAAPQDRPYLMSVGREKSPVGPGRPIVINCT